MPIEVSVTRKIYVKQLMRHRVEALNFSMNILIFNRSLGYRIKQKLSPSY